MDDEKLPLVCSACAAKINRCITLRCEARGLYFGNEVTFMPCETCGFVFAPGNTHEYDSEQDFCDTSRPLQKSGRVGTDSRPGREYFMTVMANDLLMRACVVPNSMLIYGSGLSRDHQWLTRQFPDIQVFICDLMNFQGVEYFVGLESQEKFDIVIACEVVEHFTDIESDFSSLLAKVSECGIVVLSTNIRDGSPLRSLTYPFIPGHTAYYSGRALTLIAKRFDPRFQIDFRVPQAALAQLGPTKRYVLIYRDSRIMPAISEYFSEHFTAPSEACVHLSFLARVWRWIRRRL
jgi:hypothetical protein